MPWAYATLFFFVMPALMLLRRWRLETLWSFSVTCGVATSVPWLALSFIFFPRSFAAFLSAPDQALKVLLPPALLAALAAAVIYGLFVRPAVTRPA